MSSVLWAGAVRVPAAAGPAEGPVPAGAERQAAGSEAGTAEWQKDGHSGGESPSPTPSLRHPGNHTFNAH